MEAFLPETEVRQMNFVWWPIAIIVNFSVMWRKVNGTSRSRNTNASKLRLKVFPAASSSIPDTKIKACNKSRWIVDSKSFLTVSMQSYFTGYFR